VATGTDRAAGSATAAGAAEIVGIGAGAAATAGMDAGAAATAGMNTGAETGMAGCAYAGAAEVNAGALLAAPDANPTMARDVSSWACRNAMWASVIAR
jgi:predicted branched-subunit amino acid permease